MDKEEFFQQADDLRSRISDHLERWKQLSDHGEVKLSEALEDMSETLEELVVSEEELIQQNEALAVAQTALEEERRRYQSLFEFAPDGYLVTDHQGVILEANQAAEELFNVPVERLIGKPLATYMSDESLREFRRILNQLNSGSDWSSYWEFWLKPRAQEPRLAGIKVAVTEGEPPLMRWSLRDITAQKQAEVDLARRSDYIKLLQEVAVAANEADTLQAALQYAIDRICAFTGWPIGHVYLRRPGPQAELEATPIWHLEDLDQFESFRQTTEQTRFPSGMGLSGRVLATGKPQWVVDVTREPGFSRPTREEDRLVRAGLFFPILTGREVAGVLEFFSLDKVEPDEVLLDIMGQIGTQLGRVVERKQAEQKLRSEKEFTEQVIESSYNGIFAYDDTYRVTIWNQRMERITGIQRGQALDRSIFEVLPFLKEIGEEDYLAQPLIGKSVISIDRPFHIPENGREGFFEGYYTPLQVGVYPVQGGLCILRDITEVRQAEEALQRSEARFQTIFEEADLGISLVDLQGNVIESNPAFQEMLGYSADELLHLRMDDFTHPDDLPTSQAQFQSLRTGERDRYQVELRYIHKDGQVIPTHNRISLFRDREGKPLYIIHMIENVNLQKQLESELAEVERRLSDRGEIERLQLAQELHDGPLQDLLGATYHLSAIADAINDQSSLSHLSGALATLQQVANTLRSICGELRPPTLAPFGLEKAIRSHAARIQKVYPELSIELDLARDRQDLPERVRLALFRIYQHIMANVVRHAQASQVWVHFVLDPDQVVLEIQDNGRGFQVPKRSVELVRQGHFGLVGAAERAEAIGGQFQISSTPGQGTAVKVTVPRDKKYQAADVERLLNVFRESELR